MSRMTSRTFMCRCRHLRCLTVKLRGRREAPNDAEGAQSLSARGAKSQAPHGPLQRLLAARTPCPAIEGITTEQRVTQILGAAHRWATQQEICEALNPLPCNGHSTSR